MSFPNEIQCKHHLLVFIFLSLTHATFRHALPHACLSLAETRVFYIQDYCVPKARWAHLHENEWNLIISALFSSHGLLFTDGDVILECATIAS